MKPPPFTRKPLFRWSALGLTLTFLLGLGVRSRPARGPGPAVPEAASGAIRGTGTLESVQEVPLAFKVGGRILALPLDEGSVITEGQVLGTLDPRDLGEQLGVAQAARGAAQAGIGKAQADLQQALASRQRALADFERIKRLQSDGILSRADLDAAQERLKVTEAGVSAMTAVGTQARQGEALARSTEALQRLSFEEGRLLSPVSGLLTRRLREPGNIVAAGTPVLTVISTRKLWVRAWVDETALGQLQVGQGARVVLRSHPGRSFRGRVDRIGRQADRQTHELLVDVEVLELPPLYAVGQRADVQIQTGPKGGV
jgi:RND family efflux transporter MFP subunit